MLNNYTPYVIEQKQEQEIIRDYKKMVNSYNKLKSETEKVYDASIENNAYREKLEDQVDNTIIEKDNNRIEAKFVTDYINDKNKLILNSLSKEYELNTSKLHKLFSTRNKILSKRLNDLSVDKIGTVLNVLNNFYSDVFNDVKRNKVEWESLEVINTRSITIDSSDILHNINPTSSNIKITIKEIFNE